MPELPGDTLVSDLPTVRGPDILKFLENDPEHAYGLCGMGSSIPVCRMRFKELAASIPPDVNIYGVVYPEKIWFFEVDIPAANIADLLYTFKAEEDMRKHLGESFDKVCWRCGQIKKLKEFAPETKECLQCAEKRNISLATINKDTRRLNEIRGGEWHSEEEWQALLAACSGKCLRCGSTERITRDHVIPVSRGGANSIDNIQPLCWPCNSWKHARTIDYRANPRLDARKLLGQDAVPGQHTGREERSGGSHCQPT